MTREELVEELQLIIVHLSNDYSQAAINLKENFERLKIYIKTHPVSDNFLKMIESVIAEFKIRQKEIEDMFHDGT